jgi:hypothetical protein
VSSTSIGTKVTFEKIQKILNQKSDEFFQEDILQDPLGCKQIVVTSLAQNQSPRWLIERKLRISGSKAHLILNAFKSLTASMAYGTAMEKKAKEHTSLVTGNGNTALENRSKLFFAFKKTVD